MVSGRLGMIKENYNQQRPSKTVVFQVPIRHDALELKG